MPKRSSGKDEPARTTITLSKKTVELLDVLAEDTDMDRSELVEDILERFFDDEDLIDDWYPPEDEEGDEEKPRKSRSKPAFSAGLTS